MLARRMATSRRLDQKERIRRKAARLFAANGYDATGIQELSEAVNLGRGALYHHIGSKDQLLHDIITHAVVEVVREAEELLEEPMDVEERFRAVSRLAMASVAGHLPEWTVFFRELPALKGPMRRDAEAWRARFEDVWAAVLEQGAREGVFRVVDPVVVKGILGMHNYAHVWLRSRGRLSADEISDAFCDVLLAGLRVDGAPRR